MELLSSNDIHMVSEAVRDVNCESPTVFSRGQTVLFFYLLWFRLCFQSDQRCASASEQYLDYQTAK